MRLRHTLSTALGALALVVSLPASASAATGDFSYRYTGFDGTPQSATLHDPASPGCITLPEVADPDSSEPAFAPHNDTDEWVMVFTEPDCTGDSWTLRPHGHPATDRLTLRSVFLTGRHGNALRPLFPDSEDRPAAPCGASGGLHLPLLGVAA